MSNYAGLLEYKCRRCGEVNANTHTPDCMISLIAVLTGSPSPFPGGTVKMHDLHMCADGHMGVADLIGGKLDKALEGD